MKILHSAARPLVLPSPYSLPTFLLSLFSKSKKKGLNRKRVNRHRSGGGCTALCPRPTAQIKTRGQSTAGAIRLRPSWATGGI